jgi:Flp pilus assembly protein TadG
VKTSSGRRRQRGVAAVELGLVMALFVTVLLGVMEMSRLLWTWNAAAEATRLGARLAVVCDVNDATVVDRMRQTLPALTASNIQIDYLDPGKPLNSCSAQTCKSVRVTLSGYTHRPIIPLAALAIAIPTFQTTLTKEVMQSAGNPVCN